MEKILTVNNVAEILQVKAITVREMFRERRLRGFKVGKSWRTTEAMLREDIDALSRGESPAELAMPGHAIPVPAPAPTTPAPITASKRTIAPDPASDIAASPAAKPRAAKKQPEAPEKPDGADDTQQLLF